MQARVAAILVLLAVSPVTAPFLTYDIFGALPSDAPSASIVVDAKKADGDKPIVIARHVTPQSLVRAVEVPWSTYGRADFLRRTLPVPLRI